MFDLLRGSDPSPGRRPGPADRAVSVQINWVLSLAITSILIAGLLIGMNTFLRDQRSQVADSEMRTLGNRITADLATADRLVENADGTPAVQIRTAIPEKIAGSDYTVEFSSEHVTSGSRDYFDVTVTLRSDELGMHRNVSVRTSIDVQETTVRGGDYVVTYDQSADHIEVAFDGR